jgi:phosphopantothenoylcysteine decarboxylase/phosphopantothenate--cysteine ligase
MLEPAEILQLCADLFPVGALAGKHLLITGGPTQEPIDPVRFITNHSSGKMAYALATEAALAGAQVTLISGPVSLPTPASVKRVDVTTAQQMLNACLDAIDAADIFIGVAAVADYRPVTVQTHKIKKNADSLEIQLTKNPDIISEIAKLPNRPIMVGFAAETENLVANGRDKLTRKKLDIVFANNATETFNSDSIAFTAITATSVKELPAANKHLAARQMLQLIIEQLNQ